MIPPERLRRVRERVPAAANAASGASLFAETALPPDYVRAVIELQGAVGRAWLQALPSLVASIERDWQLTALPPVAGLTFNVVAPVVLADGGTAILKLGVPGGGLQREAAALAHFAGQGAAALLRVDLERGVLLLERVSPGTTLEAVQVRDDEQATAIAADVMRRLHQPPPSRHTFPTIAEWAADLGRLRPLLAGTAGPLPARLVDEAERRFADLIASQADPVLLHGDLHHGNILASNREQWLTIDPKGVVGEPAAEAGALLRNPAALLTAPDPGRLLARRIDQLAEALEVDRARIRGWGLAQAVLAAAWGLEDSGRIWEQGLVSAELLAALPE